MNYNISIFLKYGEWYYFVMKGFNGLYQRKFAKKYLSYLYDNLKNLLFFTLSYKND
jgi:hypothetical protein